MSVAELLGELNRRGVELWTEGEQLRFRAPAGAITPELRQRMVERKAELLELVRRGVAASSGQGELVREPERRFEPFPLTDMQEAYWLGRRGLYELGDVSTYAYLEFESDKLEVPRLERAWRRLVERHDMLRCVLAGDGQQQVLREVPPFVLQTVDLRGQPPEVVRERLAAERERMSHQVLPLERWPLFDLRACLLDGGRVRLFIGLDLFILDGASYFRVLREWSELYERPEAELPPLELTFRDCVLSELAWRKSPAYERSMEYWRTRVASLPAGPEFPAPRVPAEPGPTRFVRRTARLEAEAWTRLKERATRRGLTPSMVLCTAYAKVLATWSRRPHFCLNLTLLARPPIHPQIEEVVGDFTSGLLLEVDESAPVSFASQAARLQERFWKDMEHSRVSSVQVLRELTRTQGRVEAAMPVVFTSVLDRADRDRGSATSWLGTRHFGVSQTPQVLLDHQVAEEDGALAYNWDAIEARFPPGQLDDMLEAYQRLLRRLVEEDAAWEAERLELVPAAQLAQRAQVNATSAPISSELLHTLFERQARERPEAPAVITSRRTLTYGELARLAHRVSHRLRAMDVRPGTLVGVVMEKGWEQVAAVLGVLGAGAAYLPIDSGVPRERLRYLLENSRASVAITQPWVDGQLEWPASVRRLVLEEAALASEDERPLPPVQQPGDLAYVIYTSGSTGNPKGVMIDHRGAVNTILDINSRFGVGPSDRVMAVSALTFDLSVYDVFGPLAAGGALVMPGGKVSDPAEWASLVSRHGVTVWNSVPAIVEMLVDHLDRPGVAPERSLRLVMMSGDWIPVELPARVRERFEGVRVMSLGGATEASIWSILYPIEKVEPGWRSIPYGRPMVNQTFHVLDGSLEPRPVWVPGELYIGGIGVAQGYFADEERTRRGFIRHPRTGERLYRTGDLGRYLPDGNIEFLGREDHQVKIQGYRIECGEVEAALRQHPRVREALVMARDDRGLGKRLVGYVLAGAEAAPEREELRGFLREKLPSYMVPSHFVVLEAWPLTANGKVDRKALPAPEQAAAAAGESAEPRTDSERTVAALMAQVLGLEKATRATHFFEVGGDSLKAVRLSALLQGAFQVEVPMRRLLEDPTVAGIALLVEELLIDQITQQAESHGA